MKEKPLLFLKSFFDFNFSQTFLLPLLPSPHCPCIFTTIFNLLDHTSSMAPSKRITSYNYYFGKVLAKRLRFLHKINVLLSIFVAILIGFPYNGFWANVGATLYRAPVIFLSLWLVKVCRDANSTVEYSRSKTLALHIVQSVFTRRYLVTLCCFATSAYIAFFIFISQLPLASQYYVVAKEYRHKPAVNDEWVYFWFHAYYIALLYALQHIVFQRNRLRFKYGVNTVRPESVLFSNVISLFGNAVAFNVLSSASAPVVYYCGRSIIYKINWLFFAALKLDSSIPRFHIGFSTLFNVGYVSFFVFCAWELVNHVYNIYATIGCLDAKKPISSYSEDPIGTLLSGLRDMEPQNQLSRLSAFQELAYMANTRNAEEVKRRNAVYNIATRGSYVWPAILDECALVIREVSSRVNYRLKSDMAALKETQLTIKEEPASLFKQEKFIFGNSYDTTVDTSEANITATSSPLKKYEDAKSVQKQPGWAIQFQKLQQSPLGKWISFNVLKPIRAYVVAFVTPKPTEPKSFAQHLQAIKAQFHKYYENFLSSTMGIFFRISIKRDAESRVVNPVNYGNAVIALTGLLIHAVEEDRSGTISNNHISEVLNLLERPIRACANYTDILPASVYVPPELRGDEQATKHHLIALLHDLTMNEFFQLCVKYNFKLNDLQLSSRAFKLAKWVIDASIAQQQKQAHSHSAKIY